MTSCYMCVDWNPTLVTGKDVYPHRKDLYHKLFWQCTNCGNFVGCHPGTDKPLGVIVGSRVKNARIQVHDALDPIWRSGTIKRSQLYRELTDKLGWKYHTANIRSVKEANEVLAILATYEITIEPIEGTF